MRRWAWVVLLVVGATLWGCVDQVTPLPPPPSPVASATGGIWPAPPSCETILAEALPTLAAMDARLRAVETEAAGLQATAAAMTPQCEVTVVIPVTAEPEPTYTPYPTPTSAPDFCRRCIRGMEEPFGCPPGYICELCWECYWLCVPADSPRGGCNFCGGIVIP